MFPILFVTGKWIAHTTVFDLKFNWFQKFVAESLMSLENKLFKRQLKLRWLLFNKDLFSNSFSTEYHKINNFPSVNFTYTFKNKTIVALQHSSAHLTDIHYHCVIFASKYTFAGSFKDRAASKGNSSLRNIVPSVRFNSNIASD